VLDQVVIFTQELALLEEPLVLEEYVLLLGFDSLKTGPATSEQSPGLRRSQLRSAAAVLLCFGSRRTTNFHRAGSTLKRS